jgi:hypothetical protein
MKVVNWKRWNRVKMTALGCTLFVSLCAAGGLESDPYEPMPNTTLAFSSAGVALLIMLSFVGKPKD